MDNNADAAEPRRIHLFGDEAGDLDFGGGSRYFIACTVAVEDCSLGNRLLALWRELAWNGADLGDYFHATDDKQPVRDQVFELLQREDFRVDVTLLEKAKLYGRLRNEEGLYRLAWYLHFKYVIPRVIVEHGELMVVCASRGTKKKRRVFRAAVDGVVDQIAAHVDHHTGNWPAGSDPCLQVADYCAWAIQRRYEHTHMGAPDDRSYVLIEDKIASELDAFNRTKIK